MTLRHTLRSTSCRTRTTSTTQGTLALLALAATSAGCLGPFRAPLDEPADAADAANMRADSAASDGSDAALDGSDAALDGGGALDGSDGSIADSADVASLDADDVSEGGAGEGGAGDGGVDGGDAGISCDAGMVCSGRCVDTSTDSMNCGACGNACVAGANAVSVACVAGRCVPTCAALFADCDRDASNGCERATNTTTNCGGCGTSCSRTNAEAECSTGVCRVRLCNAGFADCDSADANGCEADLNTVATCGGCRTACSGATPVCSSAMSGGTCTSGCMAPQTRCGMSCVDTSSSLDHCGRCDNGCSFSNASATCSGGVCTLGACLPNRGNCDGVNSNGCETDTSVSLLHCGGCGVGCSLNHAVSVCSSGACTVSTCAMGYGNCNATVADGCEVDLTTTVMHCGTCGHGCMFNNGAGSCVGARCAVSSCNAGYGNCDSNGDNGCEQRLNTLTHCGGCGASCSIANAVASCSTGTCQFSACNMGYVDVDGVASNGCECRFTNANDPPDPAGVDENCDGVDGVLGRTLFVNGSTGSDTNLGTNPLAPKRTLRGALSAATGTINAILLTTDAVDERIHATPARLVSGVGIFGGYNAGYATRTMMRTPLLEPRIALEAVSLAPGTFATLSQLDVQARDVGAMAGSSVALRVINTGAWAPTSLPLLLQNVRLQAGLGGVGARGADGMNGADGANGGNGVNGGLASGAGAGGTRGVNTLCTGGDGGGGGAGGMAAAVSRPGIVGEAGLPVPAGGAGGSFGAASTLCTSNGNSGGDGATSTAAAAAGGPGMGATNQVLLVGNEVSAATGGAGQPGPTGAGGGGGGGGANACVLGAGGGGGGGGAGGCGGRGGFGGQPGGSSVALLLINSAVVVPADCSLVTAGGGTGGAGGSGGMGGRGGGGGTGGARSTGTPQSGAGGGGGNGSSGAGGGLGGGGAGGHSVCVATSGLPYMPGMLGSSCMTGAAGGGGSGGNSGANGQQVPLIHIP